MSTTYGARVRIEETLTGEFQEHFFDENGFDVWGYDQSGRYDSAHDRAPFQASPFRTEHTQDGDDQ